MSKSAIVSFASHQSSFFHINGRNTHRVWSRVGAYNTRATRCYLACGFVVEGRVLKTALVAGERRNDPTMARLCNWPGSRR